MATNNPDDHFETINGYVLSGKEDDPDFRDFPYQPALVRLADKLDPPAGLNILDQGKEGACTGFGLAAAVNLLLAERNETRTVSARMLYESAKKFDEWEGEDYSGSSCRGAVKGWNSMGVCSDGLAPYRSGDNDWELNITQAKDARSTTLGAYYRVAKRLSDYHAALNEVGILYVSARVHRGWSRGYVRDGRIRMRGQTIGGHAFAIVGYNTEGFYVQNSWGPGWGDNGVALWTYEDWLENGKDAWVVRLAVKTPQIWHLTPSGSGLPSGEEGLFAGSPKRSEIVGHFVHIDDGQFDNAGKYWTNLTTVEQTAELVATSTDYDHLLLYAHGGLNSISASARRVAAMKQVFKDNGIYPFHFMYDTGLLEEVKDLVIGKKDDVEARAGGFTDWTDKLIEKATRPAGRAIWREMKQGATSPFDNDGAGTQTVQAFIDAFAAQDATPKQIHIVGHSTGAILLARLLDALGHLDRAPRIRTCLLLAPACTHTDFNTSYRPLLRNRQPGTLGIDRMRIYNLDTDLERQDTVTPLYRKSLLYLVSNAFEETKGERILGLQEQRRRLGRLPASPTFRIETSNGVAESRSKTASKTHGGFDNDPSTMNDILRLVLRRNAAREFTADDLQY